MNIVLQILLCVLVGYALGNFSPSYLLGRKKGYDIREEGSKNAGATNAIILLGKNAFFLTAILDMLKAFAACRLCRLLFPTLTAAGAIGGAACIIGHIYPVLLRFRGGKGLASYIGAMAILDIRFALVILVTFCVLVFITDYIVVGTMLIIITFPLWCVYVRDYVTAAMMGAVTLIMIYKHRENLVRIANGTEKGLRKANKGEYRIDKEKAHNNK